LTCAGASIPCEADRSDVAMAADRSCSADRGLDIPRDLVSLAPGNPERILVVCGNVNSASSANTPIRSGNVTADSAVVPSRASGRPPQFRNPFGGTVSWSRRKIGFEGRNQPSRALGYQARARFAACSAACSISLSVGKPPGTGGSWLNVSLYRFFNSGTVSRAVTQSGLSRC
jgi:hypothetical protein